jgi:hypothetical protein
MARKAKRETVEQDQAPAKTPEEIFRDHYPNILAAKVDEEKATEEARKKRSSYRATLKAFKKAGGNVDALTAALAVRNRDPDEVTREWRDINRYARLMNLPIGAQLGLFEDGETVAAKVDAAQIEKQAGPPRKLTDKTLTAIKKDGAAASASGKFATANPYEEGTPEFLAWAGGYRDHQAELVHAMGQNGSGETQPAA